MEHSSAPLRNIDSVNGQENLSVNGARCAPLRMESSGSSLQSLNESGELSELGRSNHWSSAAYEAKQKNPSHYFNSTDIIDFPVKNNSSNRKKEPSLLDKVLDIINIELDDLIILGVLFLLYTEKCDDLYLYIVLFMLLLDFDFDNLF